jgi:eukaryotic-like serine/threonine-protein kinase
VPEQRDRLQAALADRYLLLRELGRGGTSTVWLAQDLRQLREVAIKVLHPELAASLGSDRFLREIEIAASLTHPHILPVQESGEAGGFVYYTMPHVEGESLRDRLRREIQLPLDDALGIARQLADAIGYAHDRGLVHRDIKPENILLEGDYARVADFGVARAIETSAADRLTGTGLTVGTPAYMSPEQAGGSERLDGRSDTYSLGCVVFEMLAGEPPFSAPTAQALAAKHLNAPPPPLRLTRPMVPEGVDRALQRALAKVPADRHRTAREFAHALSESGPHPKRSRWHRRAMAVLTGSFAAALIALLARGQVRRIAAGGERADSAATIGPPRIAVLYFDDLTPDSALRRVADGLTEQLIHELSGVNAFRVVSRNGVWPYRGRRAPFDSMVAALRVNAIVDGSIRRTAGGIRARAQLIDAGSDTYLDSLAIELPLGDTTTFLDNAAQVLAAGLRRQLGREVRLHAVEPDAGTPAAVTLTLKARREREDAAEMAEQGHPEDLRTALNALARADSLLRRAQRADPHWLRPVLDRGWVAGERAALLSGADKVAAVRDGLGDAEEAVRRAPGNPEALELRARSRWNLITLPNGPSDSTRVGAVERDLRAALDRDSTLAGAWATLSFVLWYKGSLAEAGLAARRALREDAYLADARDVLLQLFFGDLWTGDFAQANRWCERGRLSFPNDWRFLECGLTLMRHDQDARPEPDSAWSLVRALERLDPAEEGRAEGRPYHSIYRRVVAATISARAGRFDVARAELARARRDTKGDSTLRLDLAYDEAYLRLTLGERERATALLRGLITARPFQGPILARDPLLRGLRLQD